MNYMNSNGMLNIALINQKVDEVVFDYIDSKPNWEIAYHQLDRLMEECTKFFLQIVKKNGELPSLSTYWNLFLELNAKLIYFSTLALHKYENKSIGQTSEVLAMRLETSALCLTNVQSEESIEFLEEIKATYDEVAPEKEFKGNIERTSGERLQAYYEFAKQY